MVSHLRPAPQHFLGELDRHLFAQGRHWQLADILGAHPTEHEGEAGVRFAVWAPNARSVSVVGDFNDWDGGRHPMMPQASTGVWAVFVPGASAGARYKYDIQGPNGERLPLRADPVARATEMPPATASVVPDEWDFVWTDDEWLAQRAHRQALEAPMAIYELHVGSWRHRDGRPMDWTSLAPELIGYARDM